MNKKLFSSCKKIFVFLFILFLSSNMVIGASAAKVSTFHDSNRSIIAPTAPITSDADLQVAIVNANPGDTILLTEDLTLTGTIMINKSITINGAGHTLNLSADYDNRHFNIPDRAEVVLENLILMGNGGITNNGGIFVSNATLDIKGCTIANNVSTANGGGIYAFGASTVNISEGSRIIDNTAIDGYGGGIYALNNSSINITGGSIISGNTAHFDGGGIYTSDLTKLTTDTATFEGNSASTSYPWEIDVDSDDPDIQAASVLHQNNILNTTYTSPFTNAYNNFDIYYDGTNVPVTTTAITVDYYMDSIDEDHLLDSVEFTYNIGETLDDADLVEILGENWINENKPEGYGDGQLQVTLPITVDSEDIIIDILYTKPEVPKTGDNSNVWPFVSMLLSLSAFAGLYFIVKRRQYQNHAV